jgi:hypothetical protein
MNTPPAPSETRVNPGNLLDTAWNSVKLGAEWLVNKQNENGSFVGCADDLLSSYKVPLAFSLAGTIDRGVRCLRRIKSENVNKEGELSSGRGTIKTAFANNQRNFANYMDGWVAIGAWRLGDYDFAEGICERLVLRQASHGGVLTGPQKWSGAARYDILTTASCGRAFLLTGRRSEALKAASFLSDAIIGKHQRNSGVSLDMSFDESWDPVDSPIPEDRPYYRFEYNRRGERVFCPAFACVVLCEIYQVSHSSNHLEAARRWFDAITKTPEFADHSLSNGKSGLAAGALALAAGDRRAAGAALWIMSRTLARQQGDGEFVSAAPSQTQSPTAKRIETTAEHTAWAAEYVRLLSSGLGQVGGST